MADILVFITATIHAGETPYVKRHDPDTRKRDYLEAFKGWLSSNGDSDILLCENSNADLSDFRTAAGKAATRGSVRLLTFPGNSGAQSRGKGFGELEMLRYSFETVPAIKDYRYILKVSGRYQLLNRVEIIKQIRLMNADLICDIHQNLTYGDTRTVAFKPKVALDYLIPYQDQLDDQKGEMIETLMARCLHRTVLDGGAWAPLPCTPYAQGISGTTNTPEPSGLLYRIKQDIKRKVAIRIYRS